MALAVTSPTTPQTDDVEIDYTYIGPAGFTPVTAQYSPDGGLNWYVCTESSDPASDGTLIAHGGVLTAYKFIWDANADLGLVSAAILISLQVGVDIQQVGPFGHYNTILAGAPYTWLGVFAANNTVPSGIFVFPNPDTSPSVIPIAVQGGTMLIVYKAFDEDADLLDVEFSYTTDGGRTWKTCAMGVGGDGNTGLTSDTIANGGVQHTFAWATEDLRSAQIQLRGRLTDDYDISAYFYSESFWVENKDQKTWWVPKQVPPNIYKLDPDGVIQYWADLAEAWRIREATDILGFEDLFDPDLCPQEYLPHLAARIGLRIDQNAPEAIRRRQITQALSWYKSKGLQESVSERFAGIGYEARVVPLYTDGYTCSDAGGSVCSRTNAWLPHSRVDLYTLMYDPDTPIAPTNFAELIKHFDEVRPIHVLVRDIITGVVEIELYPLPDDADGLIDMAISPVSTVHPMYLLPAGSVVNAAPSVEFTLSNYHFQVGDVVEIEGTSNYDGQHIVLTATLPGVAPFIPKITFAATFAVEVLVGDETIKLVPSAPLPLAYQHVPNDRLDDDSWLAHPGPGLSYFNGTRQAGTYGGGLIPSYGFNRNPFTDEQYDYMFKPEIGPPFREIVSYGAGTGASWTYGDGGSYYDDDVGEIRAYNAISVPFALPGHTDPIIV